MSVDLFERRTMGELLDKRPKVQSFFRDTFFRVRNPVDTERVDFDVITGTKTLAPFGHSALPGKVMDRRGYTTHTFSTPLLNPKRVTTAADFLDRRPGESMYATQSPEDRAAEILAEDLYDLEAAIARREEWLCANALEDGALAIVGDGVNDAINFGRSASHDIALLGATARWTHADSDPYANLMTWFDLVVEDSDVPPTHCVMGSEAAAAFLANTKMQAKLDVLRMEAGKLEPQYRELDMIRVLGRLAGLPMDIVVPLGKYRHPDTGAATPFFDPKKVLLASTRARSEILYGAVAVADAARKTVVLVRGERVPHSWVEEEPPQRFVKVSARPLPVPLDINSTLVAQVVA